MKILFLAIACSVCLQMVASAEYRTFTGVDGREIEAKIIKVDSRSGTITVERDNKRKSTVPTNVFSAADQTYIKEWVSAQAFLSNSKLRISVEKKKGSTGNDKSQTKRPKPPCHYEISLENRSGGALEGMHVEYCLYKITESSRGRPDKLDTTHDKSSSFEISNRGKHQVKTKTIQLFRNYTSQTETTYDIYGGFSSSTSYNKTTEDNLEGIRVRIYFKTPSGNTFMREVCEPASIAKKFTWKQH